MFVVRVKLEGITARGPKWFYTAARNGITSITYFKKIGGQVREATGDFEVLALKYDPSDFCLSPDTIPAGAMDPTGPGATVARRPLPLFCARQS